ncbi:MAG: hypothetical protein ACXADH_05110 [Candidatus Kariarchaeaceae archaeon]|jgi:hypothetical protein
MKGTDTYCWKLETTGASDTDSIELELDNTGRITQLVFTFPAGSEYAFHLRLRLDGAIVFPSKLSQELRGDNQTKTFDIDKPFQRGSIIKIEMISDATLKTNIAKACWIDVTVRYE